MTGSTTNILITGANRGIGRGFVEKFLSRPNHTVFATVRNPDSEDAKSLLTIPAASGSKTVVLKSEATSDTDSLKAVKVIESHGYDRLDIVIANAGIFTPDAYKPVAEMRISDLKNHFDVNTCSVVRIFQATLPLLTKAETPKFILVSSLIGTIGGLDQIPFPNAAYGASKAAANYLLRKIHFENEKITAVAFHPGSVKTKSGNEACQFVGIPEAFVEVADSIQGMVEKIDQADKKTYSGEFLSFDETKMQW